MEAFEIAENNNAKYYRNTNNSFVYKCNMYISHNFSFRTMLRHLRNVETSADVQKASDAIHLRMQLTKLRLMM